MRSLYLALSLVAGACALAEDHALRAEAARAADTIRPPAQVASPPAGAGIIPAKGWEKLSFRNDTGGPITVKLFFSVPKEGRESVTGPADIDHWREVRLDPKPGFTERPRPTPDDTYQITLGDGELKGWNRRGGNPFAIALLDAKGENISGRFRFDIVEGERRVDIRPARPAPVRSSR